MPRKKRAKKEGKATTTPSHKNPRGGNALRREEEEGATVSNQSSYKHASISPSPLYIPKTPKEQASRRGRKAKIYLDLDRLRLLLRPQRAFKSQNVNTFLGVGRKDFKFSSYSSSISASSSHTHQSARILGGKQAPRVKERKRENMINASTRPHLQPLAVSQIRQKKKSLDFLSGAVESLNCHHKSGRPGEGGKLSGWRRCHRRYLGP